VTDRLLIACVGNVFHGDDGFGVEVARRLGAAPLPGARVVDFGIRAYDLAFRCLDPYEAVILVDAAPRGGAPGDLYLLAIEDTPRGDGGHAQKAHGALALVADLGGTLPPLYLVGCEPAAVLADDELEMGLSAPVAAAIDGAVAMILGLAGRLLAGGHADA
jgi:hydrogenase maturation protease